MSGRPDKTEEVIVADYGDLLSRLSSLAQSNRETFYAYTVETPQGGLIVVDIGRTLHLKTAEPKAMLGLTINLRRDGIIKGGTLDADRIAKQAAAYKNRPAAGAAPALKMPSSTGTSTQVPPSGSQAGVGALEAAAPLVIDVTAPNRNPPQSASSSAPPSSVLPPVSPIVSSESKPGRNDPCPCGSGKKYKKCCGRK